jgi:hypothetical protein
MENLPSDKNDAGVEVSLNAKKSLFEGGLLPPRGRSYTHIKWSLTKIV